MSKAKGIHLISGKEPVLKALTCAVEYDSGELYYDRMGRVAHKLRESGRGWLGEPSINIKQTQILNPEENLILMVSPSVSSVVLSTENQPVAIEPEEVARCIREAAFAIGMIVDEFELSSFNRIDYRERYSFACTSIEETEQWIRDLGLVRALDSLYTTFGKHFAMNCTLVFVGEECRYQLSMAGTERNAKIPVGPAELMIKHSQAMRLHRDDLVKLVKLKRHRQLDPEFSAPWKSTLSCGMRPMSISTFPAS